jgi:G6PDH family F420-dependent oxidoreductase
MLEEAVAAMRELWAGEYVTRHGAHYTVENARIFTRPDTPPPVYVSGFGRLAAELAGRIGDGYISTKPDADLLAVFRESGGGAKPAQAGYKVCWSTDDDRAVSTAHRLWSNSGLPGEVSQVLPSPAQFAELSTLVTEEMTRDSIAFGNDVDRHVDAFRPYVKAGFDEVYISQMGGMVPGCEVDGFFEFYSTTGLPRLREVES